MPLDVLPDPPPAGGHVMSCMSCDAPLAHDQRYCLHCGSPRRDILRELLGTARARPSVERATRRGALERRVPIGWLAVLHRLLRTGFLATLRRPGPAPALRASRPAALRRRVPAPVLRAWTAARARSRSWPRASRAAVPALACALGLGLLAGALAGPPSPGVAASARRVAAVTSQAPATATPSLAAGDLGALQALVAPAPPPPPPASASPASDPVTGSGQAATEPVDPASSSAAGEPAPPPPPAPPQKTEKPVPAIKPPPVKHVVVVALADKSFTEAFGPASQAPYLARELRRKGALLRRYFATAHGSLPNYIALLSGQAANPDSATGCPALTPFADTGKPAASGEVRGKGCVFDAQVPSLPGQLERKKLAWRAYVDGAAPAGTPAAPPAPCQPPPAAPDGTPAVVDRNPFLFFAAIAGAADCTAKVTGFASLATDLAAPLDAAPAFTLIVPDTCNAGRDGACPVGEPAGLARTDAWLREWIPRLEASPAYADDGAIVITFDQARVSGPEADSTSCCGQALGVNEPRSVDPQAPAPGGGRVGALVLSPRVKAGTVSDVPYNHFALLRTIEDAFDLKHLGLAGEDGLKVLGADVFGKG